MKYSGKKDYQHSSLEKTGLLITNLGTPEAPTAKALRKYLAEFLWDPRVVEIPRPIWWLVLNLIILRIRPKKSAAVYKKIWTQQGSPLMSHTLAQLEGIKQQLQAQGLGHIEVECAMRYGQPSIEYALQKLQCKKNDCSILYLRPVYWAIIWISIQLVFTKVLNYQNNERNITRKLLMICSFKVIQDIK